MTYNDIWLNRSGQLRNRADGAQERTALTVQTVEANTRALRPKIENRPNQRQVDFMARGDPFVGQPHRSLFSTANRQALNKAKDFH